MVMRKRILLATTIYLSSVLHAQDAKAPKLKDSVALDLRTLQLQLTNINVQILQLQQQQAQINNQYLAKLQSALKDSGLDDVKYDLDASTLAVKEKPKAEPPKK